MDVSLLKYQQDINQSRIKILQIMYVICIHILEMFKWGMA
jgi:hypothetical protein